jgi:hypothetical protein
VFVYLFFDEFTCFAAGMLLMVCKKLLTVKCIYYYVDLTFELAWPVCSVFESIYLQGRVNT